MTSKSGTKDATGAAKRRKAPTGLLYTAMTTLAVAMGGSVLMIHQSDMFHKHRLSLLAMVAAELGLLELIAILLRRFLKRQRRDENRLRENEEFARSVVDALPMHLAIIDGNGVVLSTNHAWREFAKSAVEGNDRVAEGSNYLAFCEELASAMGGRRHLPRGFGPWLAGRKKNSQSNMPWPARASAAGSPPGSLAFPATGR
jgi:hypothetical protein